MLASVIAEPSGNISLDYVFAFAGAFNVHVMELFTMRTRDDLLVGDFVFLHGDTVLSRLV